MAAANSGEGAPQAAVSTSLQAQLSAASKSIHSTSNNLLQARLVVLFTDKAIYGRAIGCFYHVFHALESALMRHKDHPDIKPFWPSLSGGLFHAQAFEVDCEWYLGSSWRDLTSPGPSTKAYVEHLNHLADTNPTLLLAHAYTQHLALAAGGQIIKRMARKQMSLPADHGTAIFEYGEASPNALRSAFCERLNALGDTMTAEQRAQMVDIHVKAFKFNNAIIAEFRIGWLPFFRGLVLLLPGFWHLRK